jgi:colicin import membrane protein
MSFELEDEVKPTCAIAEYDPIAAALATLSEKYGKVVFDVSTKVGLESAKTARAELRGYRTNLEATRKAIKNPALERCRLIDAEAKDITTKLEALEKPIAAQIEAEETRKEAEKQAKLQAEIARVTALRERISAFTLLVDTIDPTAEACQAALVRMKAIPIDATFEELQPDAQQAKDAAMFRLQNLFAQYTANEAEAERIKAERAELEELRKAEQVRREEEQKRIDMEVETQRARVKAERERMEQEIANQRQQQEVEAARVREAQQAEQRRLDEQAAALRKQQNEAAEVERQRLYENEVNEEHQRQQAAIAEIELRHKANEADERLRKAAPLLLDALDNLINVYIGAVYDTEQDARKDSPPALMKAWKASAIAKGKNYFAEDGTLMNADGTRSIFDDVDQ